MLAAEVLDLLLERAADQRVMLRCAHGVPIYT
jgi:hypothetical protein